MRRLHLQYFHQHCRSCRDRENTVAARRPNAALHVGFRLRGMRHRRQRDYLLASGTTHGNIEVRLCHCGYMVERGYILQHMLHQLVQNGRHRPPTSLPGSGHRASPLRPHRHQLNDEPRSRDAVDDSRHRVGRRHVFFTKGAILIFAILCTCCHWLS